MIMSRATFFKLVLVGLLVFSFAPEAESQGLGDIASLSGEGLISALTSQLVGLWQSNDFELLGHYCSYTVRPKIRRFQLYFTGRMWCPGWTPIRGEAQTRSRSGVLNDTISDFVRKALSSGLITEQEGNDWLNSSG
ncbi:hypothetical protein SK128_021551 [Halocaridina rubra]|uniref:Anti-lipopolysaccharide factor n=1 Tax=Halocaridina rubra TaxID=373956 RepID=A0AAN9A0F7_HALRR